MGTEGSTVLEPVWRGLPQLGHSSVSGSATCALPPRFDAVKSARDFTRETLQRWRLEGEFDTVALVVSELVTNALRHGLTSRATSPELTSPVRLDLMRWAARLVCAVRDPSGAPPRTTTNTCTEFVDFTAESGRGLCLVESFSDGWGWHPLTGMMRGKVVWALFRIAPA
ncbi:Anti-sigma regulatory factor (Ser/Thr protein kinase) [Streptomyces sp. WMMB 714]|jgi:anti-sigma regulatory factor (Ser/Thr protein kinase)|uniref:ATP-binding protein n=1 Tax=Streptomyces sp. WMMB 714 TaxID=1286822 RepID=UPI0005F7C952|nr:ATP-binding protein [Streptomyces sp. WMMB 714]SCK45434.1 Anti-sigma regulatory factor (Ser/Thr protein kinase) [Streptomyces sp. WMMB 714]